MSLAQQLGGQDVTRLLRIGAIASLCLAGGSASPYNLPLMLFGIVAHELTAIGPWKTFITLLLPSLFFDIFTLLSTGIFGFLITLLIMVLKVPIYFSARRILGERGEEMGWGYEGLVGGVGSARDMWNERRAGNAGYQPMSMPGGFSTTPPSEPPFIGSRSPHSGAQAQAQVPAPKFPSSGGHVLGNADDLEGGRGGGYQG